MTDRPALAARTDRRLVRSVHHSVRYLLVEIAAPPATAAAVRPRQQRSGAAIAERVGIDLAMGAGARRPRELGQPIALEDHLSQ